MKTRIFKSQLAARILFLVSTVLLACSDNPSLPMTTAVIVTVPGVSAEISSLRVTVRLDGQKSKSEIRELAPSQSPFALTLPEGSNGQLAVTIDGITQYRMLRATGSGQVAVTPGMVKNLEIQLTRQEVCDMSGWCFQQPLQRGDNINRIWAFDNTNIWAVGNRGLFLKWDGSLWNQIPDVPAIDWKGALNGMWALAPDNIWISSLYPGGLYHWDGKSWTPTPTSGINAQRLWASGPNDVWGVGKSGQAFHYTGGPTPLVPPTGLSQNLWGVGGSAADDVWLVGDNGAAVRWDGSKFNMLTSTGIDAPSVWVDKTSRAAWVVGRFLNAGRIVVSTDAGQNWTVPPTPAGLPPLFDVAGTAQNDVWAVGRGGFILHWDGAQWSQVATNVLSTLLSIAINPSAANDVWFAGEGGTVLHWNGNTVETRLGGVPAFMDVWGTDNTHLWAVGDGGAIYKYDGSVWLPQQSGTTENLLGIWGSASNDIWVVGNNIVLRGNGTEWHRAVAPTQPTSAAAIWGFDKQNIWMAGRSGMIFHWDGTIWNTEDTKINQDVTQISGSEKNNVWVIGRSTNLSSQWDGSTWTSHLAPENLLSVKAFSATDVWATAGSPKTYHWTGTKWDPTTNGVDQLQSVWGTSASELWSVGPSNTIQFSSSLGKSWVGVMAGQPSPGFDDGANSRLHRVWGLDSQNVWAVGDGGTILRRQ